MFLIVECAKYPKVCAKHNVEERVQLRLYPINRQPRVDMNGERAAYGIAMFLHERTAVRLRHSIDHAIRRLSIEAAARFIAQEGGVRVAAFVDSSAQFASQIFLPTLFEVAAVFREEPDMAFGVVECPQARVRECIALGAEGVPILRVYRNHSFLEYEGVREVPPILDWLNDVCERRRRADGGVVSASREWLLRFVGAPPAEQRALARETSGALRLALEAVGQSGASAALRQREALAVERQPGDPGYVALREQIEILRFMLSLRRPDEEGGRQSEL